MSIWYEHGVFTTKQATLEGSSNFLCYCSSNSCDCVRVFLFLALYGSLPTEIGSCRTVTDGSS